MPMLDRAFKLRLRRKWRVRQRQVEELGQQAGSQFERNVLKRLDRLRGVRRFVLGWAALVLLLCACLVGQIRGLAAFYETLSPVPGGTYTEGITGTFTNANPIYATNAVDSAVSHLVFASLFTYNDQGQLVGDLAQDWSVDERGTTYTVHLKPHLTWQDGQPLTANDVAFTYGMIQNPQAQSPLEPSWRGIGVQAADARTVLFKLPSPLSSFPYSMTNGIIPQHILGAVGAVDMRSAAFNTQAPVGAGPFAWRALQVAHTTADGTEVQIALRPFNNYYGGKPKLDGFVVRSFSTQDRMVQSFKKQELTAMAGLNDLPASLQGDHSLQTYNMLLSSAVMTFFRNSQAVLSSGTVRQALVKAANVDGIIAGLNYPTRAVREPLLQGQLGFNPSYAQAGYDPTAANAQLDGAGWKRGPDGIRRQNGQPLAFRLAAPDTPEYASVARQLQQQWRQVGADVQLALQNATDFQASLTYHNYDALLYGISIGADPDVFVYWDSSQADPNSPNRLNFSEYKSSTADASLRAGRSRSDPALRTIKYQAFLQAWQSDAPALGLYQPRFLYVTRVPVAGLSEHTINSDADRFYNVQQWMIRQAGVSQS